MACQLFVRLPVIIFMNSTLHVHIANPFELYSLAIKHYHFFVNLIRCTLLPNALKCIMFLQILKRYVKIGIT